MQSTYTLNMTRRPGSQNFSLNPLLAMPRPAAPAGGAFRKGGSSDNPHRIRAAGDTSKRDGATIRRLKMYKSGKLERAGGRTTQGTILGGDFLSRDKAGNQEITSATGRVAPDRRWFGNTRVVGPAQLDSFRDAVAARMHDPYAVLLNTRALPMGLLADPKATARSHLLDAEPFAAAFGKGAQRKRVKLTGAIADVGALATAANEAADVYAADDHVDRDAVGAGEGADRMETRGRLFDKGQSRRIWGELFKVLDCR